MSIMKNSAGFTFIELLVVISIIGVISISGIAAFTAYERSQKLNTSTLDVVSMLNLAKSRALTQVKPQVCVDAGATLDGYEVVICGGSPSCITSSVSYEMNVWCDGGSVKQTILTGNLPSNYPTPVVTGSSTYFFPVLEEGITGSGIITINDGSGSSEDIIVSSSGNITIQ